MKTVLSSFLLISFTLIGVSCQQGLGTNPCYDPYFEKPCDNLIQPLMQPETPNPKATPSLIAVLPEAVSTAKPFVVKASVAPLLQALATPTPQPLPSSGITPIARLSLGPSVFTFGTPEQTTDLVWFAQDINGNYIKDPTRFTWISSKPEIFSVENGRVKALQQSGFAEITLRDTASGLEKTMRVNMGRSGSSQTSTATRPAEIPTRTLKAPVITWVTPVNNSQFITGQNVQFEVNIQNSESTHVRFVDQNQNVVATENTQSIWKNASPLGSYQITAQLLNAQQEIIASSQARTFAIDSAGLKAYYSNTRTDKIYTLNYQVGDIPFMSVGAITDVPGASPGFPSPGGSIDAIAKHPTNGRVYYDGGSGGNKLYYWNPEQGTDAASHTFVNKILSAGSSRNFAMLTFKSGTSELYGFGSTAGNRELFRIDTETAEATLIQLTLLAGASLPTSGDMAFDQSGNLFISSGNRLYRIVFQNANEATVEQLENLLRKDDGTSVGFVSGMGFDGLNRGYVITTKAGSVLLYQFDPSMPESCVELRDLSKIGEALEGVTSSGGDMTSTHGFL